MGALVFSKEKFKEFERDLTEKSLTDEELDELDGQKVFAYQPGCYYNKVTEKIVLASCPFWSVNTKDGQGVCEFPSLQDGSMPSYFVEIEGI